MKEVVFDAAATWSDDGSSVLLLEYRYRTTEPEKPYFSQTSSKDWFLVFYETDENLGERKEIARIEDEGKDGGGLIHHAMYWLRKRKRIISLKHQTPFLFDIEKKEFIELVTPMGNTIKIVGEKLAPYAAGRSPIPSPDGKLIAVAFSASFLESDPMSPIHFVHFISFFDTETGRYLHSHRIPWPDDRRDPSLSPPIAQIQDYYRFIWKIDSSGVYLTDGQHAFLVPSSLDSKVKEINRMPGSSIPTSYGPISNHGEYFIQVGSAIPDQMQLKKQKLQDWVPFNKIPLVPIAKVRYARP